MIQEPKIPRAPLICIEFRNIYCSLFLAIPVIILLTAAWYCAVGILALYRAKSFEKSVKLAELHKERGKKLISQKLSKGIHNKKSGGNAKPIEVSAI